MKQLFGILILAALLACPAFAQNAATAPEDTSGPPHVMSLMHYIHAMNSAQPTLAFYKDVFGLEATLRQNNNPAVALLNNVPGLKLQAAMLKFPQIKYNGMEMTDFSNVDKKGATPLPTDPGAVELILPVRDIDTVLAAVKKCGAPILSANGMPAKVNTAWGPARALVVRDPDGYLVRAIEVPADKATEPGIVQPGVSLAVAVKNMEDTEKFWHGVLGMNLTGSMKFTHDKAMAELVGASEKSEYREMTTTFPDTQNTHLEFYEWKGMTRTPLHLRVPDPGAGGMVARVSDLGAMMKTFKSMGVHIESKDGAPIWFGPTVWDVFIEDPTSGINLELYQIVPKGQQAKPGL